MIRVTQLSNTLRIRQIYLLLFQHCFFSDGFEKRYVKRSNLFANHMKEPTDQLTQVVYCSTATKKLTRDKLEGLLRISQRRNEKLGITGMLLSAGRSFLQVIEGEKKNVDQLVSSIEKDDRHRNITVIIREPIAKRSFGEWTMGYADLRTVDVESIVGTNYFILQDEPLTHIEQGRARKLLDLFKKGRWRAKISNRVDSESAACRYRYNAAFPKATASKPPANAPYSFAFQPIVSAPDCGIFSHEALLRGPQDESAIEILNQLPLTGQSAFHEESRVLALHWAAHLGLSTHLNLNIMPSVVLSSPSAIPSTLEAAERYHILPGQIILEILESEIIGSLKGLSAALRNYRSTGLLFAIDDFGAGYAGLNLLAEFQPDFLKLDLRLVRDVEKKGPRQAIIRGILRTCTDLGIEIIAEGVETESEFRWLQAEGIRLFQGYFFARPALEKLPNEFYYPA
jgi:EAL domain-containing protein (putative c-di-GMP-specific phosphodiesterase class I)